jgi:hypothetical protein
MGRHFTVYGRGLPTPGARRLVAPDGPSAEIPQAMHKDRVSEYQGLLCISIRPRTSVKVAAWL